MIPLPDLLIFAAAALLMVLTPGPNMIYLISRSICQGRKAGVTSLLGVVAGFFVHMFAAAAGLTAVFLAVPMAYELLKWAGALYLIYLGVQMIRHASSAMRPEGAAPMNGWAVFRQSILANMLNPKVAIFFLAFFPQFIHPAQGHPQLQMALLGTLFVGLVMLCFGTVGLCAGWIGAWLRQNAKAEARMGKIAGSVLILLGLSLAWPSRG